MFTRAIMIIFLAVFVFGMLCGANVERQKDIVVCDHAGKITLGDHTYSCKATQ